MTARICGCCPNRLQSGRQAVLQKSSPPLGEELTAIVESFPAPLRLHPDAENHLRRQRMSAVSAQPRNIATMGPQFLNPVVDRSARRHAADYRAGPRPRPGGNPYGIALSKKPRTKAARIICLLLERAATKKVTGAVSVKGVHGCAHGRRFTPGDLVGTGFPGRFQGWDVNQGGWRAGTGPCVPPARRGWSRGSLPPTRR